MKEENNKKKIVNLVESLVLEETKNIESTLLLREDSVFVKAFIEPFTDILKTAKHGLETNITNILGNAKKVAFQFAIASIPFIASKEVTKIGKLESEKIKKKLGELNTKYADVLKRNWDTLRTRDLAGLALLFNPSLTIGTHVALESPALALGFLEILSGGNPKVVALRKKAEELSKKVLPPRAGETSSGGGGGGGGFGADFAYDDVDFGESVSHDKSSVLKEQPPTSQQQQKNNVGFTKQQLDKKVYDVIRELLKRKDIQQSIQNSPVTKLLKTSGLDAISDRASEIAKFTTVEQFEQYLGPDFKSFEQKEISSKLPKDANPEQIQQFNQQIVSELKKAYKKFYLEQINKIAKSTPGINDEVQNVLNLLNKLG